MTLDMWEIDIVDSTALIHRSVKVWRIFQLFDLNRDGGLNRDEMAALLVSINPRVKFSNKKLEDIITNDVFGTYHHFVDGERGLIFDGLFRIYDNGAGNVDRDFIILGLKPYLKKPCDEIRFDVTRDIVNDLKTLLQEKFKLTYKKSNKFSDWGWSRELGQFIEGGSESDDKCALVSKELDVFRLIRAHAAESMEEAFDRHMAIGKVLYDHSLNREALVSFRTAAADYAMMRVRPHFYAGNCLYELGRYGEAKDEFFRALEAAKEGRSDWDYLVPQIRVNLGIVLENEGMILNACEHYREAVILRPSHFRALKRLGSALVLVGEYSAGVKALKEAIFKQKDYVDAYYDLGLALIAMGDEDKAILEFQKVLDLKPGDVDALYKLGGIFLDIGRYRSALEMYTKLLNVWPNHWKAQLGKVISLFRTGEIKQAKKALKETLKTADRVELRDRIAYLKQLQNNGNGRVGAYIIVEPSKFKTADEKTTLRRELAIALDIRAFQKITKLNQCDVELIKKQMNENANNNVDSVNSSQAERSVRKASIEGILRELLGFLKPEKFVAAVKAINQKILSLLDDESKSGKVDVGLFLAVVAPLCRGHVDKRKRVAYQMLLLRSGNEGSSEIRKTDAQRYIKLLRTICVPSLGATEMLEVSEETDTTSSMVSLTEFLAMFDDPDWGFGIMSTLLKLETRERNGCYVCATCRYPIIGSRFKERKSHFSLCSHCYSGGKIPCTIKQEEYIFKEYAN
ncbi:hypothetical protein ACH5RR_026834 [Cinchona calisaya]|uniref:EF-hand domain-containing protein n=1 Tax=Cinchona calisaya TaxID=153742 RepID=A0ABD2Z6W5_9GENT